MVHRLWEDKNRYHDGNGRIASNRCAQAVEKGILREGEERPDTLGI